MIKQIVIFSTILKICHGIIGFDCGTTMPNITTFSLLDSGECDFHNAQINSTEVPIELLQIAEFKNTKIIQCKIIIHRTIFKCGIFGHLIPTENAEQEYIYDISHEKCKFIQETGVFKYDNKHTIADLKINSTTTKGIDFAGSAEGNSCSGESYTDNFGSWNKVFVHGTIKITLIRNNAQVNLNNDKLRLSSGTVCKFSDKHCLDMEGGYTFWDILPTDDCFKNKYDVLYKGFAKKFTNGNNNEITYTLNTNEITFALAAKEKITNCNREFTRTEHPKLLILEKNNNINRLYFENDIVSNKASVHLDLFTYVNSKFVYVEKHLRNQFSNIYIDLLTQKCEIERKTIQNSLSIATLSPDEFAYNIMKKPGYISKLAGEAVYLIKCTPKEVKLLHTKECYNHLPVTSGNETYFLTPKTHILVKRGIQVDCNSIVPTFYKVGDEWIKFLPTPTKTIPPNVFKPNTQIGWTYETVNSLATSGVYSQTDLDQLQQQLMFPLEKASLLNIITREMTGQQNSDESTTNMFTENTLKHIAESTWQLIIRKLTTWGSFSSMFIMILIILHVIKLIIDTIIRGYTLHTIYGWSLHLFGAVFSSITHLLTTLNKENYEENNKKSEITEEVELKEIKVIPKISSPMQPPPIPNRPPSIFPSKINPTITLSGKNMSNSHSKNHNIFSLNV